MAKTPTKIRSKARAHTDAALRVLVEIMEDRSAPPDARVAAATQVLNRGFGRLVNPQEYAPVARRFYVYSVHDGSGRIVYVGKGQDRRHLQSARRLGGKSRVRGEFDSERKALEFERRLIKRFRPHHNVVHTGTDNNRYQ